MTIKVPVEEPEPQQRDVESPPVTDKNDNDNDNDTIYDKIEFTPAGDVNRRLPILLADSGKMSVMVWDRFCDKIDDCTKPVARVKILAKILWFLVAAFFLLNILGWKITSTNADGTQKTGIGAYYGFIAPGLVVLLLLVCNIQSCVNEKVATKLTNVCASQSNYDRDLTLQLKGEDPTTWYIEVALRNAGAQKISSSEIAHIANTTTGYPAPAAPATAGGPPPKKYVKQTNGKLALNPEYSAWKNAQQ